MREADLQAYSVDFHSVLFADYLYFLNTLYHHRDTHQAEAVLGIFSTDRPRRLWLDPQGHSPALSACAPEPAR